MRLSSSSVTHFLLWLNLVITTVHFAQSNTGIEITSDRGVGNKSDLDLLWRIPPKSTALVTGGTKGIGHAIVTQLASTFGVRVLTCARKEDDLQTCLQEWKEAGYDVWGVVADVSTSEGREAVMTKLHEMIQQSDCAHVGKLDILINNVGSNRRKKTVEYTEEDFDYIFNTNLKSLYELTKLCYPYLRRDVESLQTAGPSSVIHIGSVAGGPTCIKSGTLYVRFL